MKIVPANIDVLVLVPVKIFFWF